jgi:hypothetical protein
MVLLVWLIARGFVRRRAATPLGKEVHDGNANAESNRRSPRGRDA